MTRKLLYDAIKVKLDEKGIEITKESKAAVDTAIYVALDYLLVYALSTAEDFAVQKNAYSELLVTGMFVNKIKGLMK